MLIIPIITNKITKGGERDINNFKRTITTELQPGSSIIIGTCDD